MRVEVWGETVGGTRKKENGQKWLTGAGEGECETMGGKEEEKDGGTMLTYVVVLPGSPGSRSHQPISTPPIPISNCLAHVTFEENDTRCAILSFGRVATGLF